MTQLAFRLFQLLKKQRSISHEFAMVQTQSGEAPLNTSAYIRIV